MHDDELIPWDNREVRLTLEDGSVHEGILDVTEDGGHLAPLPSGSGGLLSSAGVELRIHAHEIVKIEPLTDGTGSRS